MWEQVSWESAKSFRSLFAGIHFRDIFANSKLQRVARQGLDYGEDAEHLHCRAGR